MTLNSLLISALSPIAITVPDEYTETEDTYIVFNYNSAPANFADDAPGHEIYSVQVHLFCPSGINSLSMRRDIKQALADTDFTWPSYINASDKTGQHHVFECEIARGLEED